MGGGGLPKLISPTLYDVILALVGGSTCPVKSDKWCKMGLSVLPEGSLNKHSFTSTPRPTRQIGFLRIQTKPLKTF